jgi:aldehyde dehydrogenase (NAD+)
MNAAPTVKRVTQELGGKSPNIILDDADLEHCGDRRLLHMFNNTGQSCNAPSRMFVPAARLAEAEAIARGAWRSTVVGDPADEGHAWVRWSPRCSSTRSRAYPGGYRRGREAGRGWRAVPRAGARLLREAHGVLRGHNDMTIAREEIFGPCW